MTRPPFPSFFPPEKLRSDHDITSFSSGVPVLDEWLKRRALPNETSGTSRTYVIGVEKKVVGFYALANGSVEQTNATGPVRRNTPNPIPVMVIGRLAVDETFRGKGLGRGLLRDAVLRTLQVAAIVGVRAILVRALSEEAKRFYEHHGFSPSPLDPMTLMITTKEAQQTLTNQP